MWKLIKLLIDILIFSDCTFPSKQFNNEIVHVHRQSQCKRSMTINLFIRAMGVRRARLHANNIFLLSSIIDLFSAPLLSLSLYSLRQTENNLTQKPFIIGNWRLKAMELSICSHTSQLFNRWHCEISWVLTFFIQFHW